MKWDPLRHPVRYYKINVNEQDKPRGSRASQVLQDGLFPFWGRLCDIQATLAPYAALKQYPYTPFLFLFTLQDKLTLSSTTLPFLPPFNVVFSLISVIRQSFHSPFKLYTTWLM